MQTKKLKLLSDSEYLKNIEKQLKLNVIENSRRVANSRPVCMDL
jgi:hypothetical protein